MIYIIIPVFNRLEYTKSCLFSINEQTYKQYKVIVVDHGSTDGTSEFIYENFPDVHVLQGDESMWWTAATNLGVQKVLEISDSINDFVLTLNNDLVVRDNYLEELLKVCEENKPAFVGSVSVDINSRERVYFAGTLWNNITAKYRPAVDLGLSLKTLQKRQDFVVADLLPGRGVLIPIACIRELGLYNQRDFPHYMADEEFSLRCKKQGYNLLVATKAVVFSHVEETGLKQHHKKMDFSYWKDFYTSPKSPNNLRTRWNWAKNNTPIPLLYFTFDTARTLYSQLKVKG
ncbi:GT2 family glycosyltransferase [Pontibacter ummariensis]|uniref:Glycosyltransferase, GT2 family n=2 Tax=Pontibacter ummariensis TaxID=1610492 RepID=A0A239EL50_9BACT|nr:GT2 family glycosyltransferase [Pontibacter ummariensis]SNS45500.1 Glycosyltransferase, GT2 family [Pontibacter ummariensis]